MTTDEIIAELMAVGELPDSRVKTQRLESLSEQARAGAPPDLEAAILLELSDAYEWGAEQEKQPLVVGRLLRLLDASPDDLDEYGPHIHWRLKWMTSSMIFNPAVPLPTIYRWLDELESRYRQRGYSPRPVHAHRGRLALHLGDHDAASAQMEAALLAPRDRMSDCEACEHSQWGDWREVLGDDEGALAQWAPVFDGELSCREEPHRVLSDMLLPLVRAGRPDQARAAFLRGYPLVRRTVNLLPSVGRHLEFCALTGNEARGLEILAEHTAWLRDTQIDADSRLAFLTGVGVLLRRLAAIGHGDLPVGTTTAAALRADLDKEISEVAARYDARNGNHAYSDRIAARLAREPLVDELPLGRPSRLPVPSPRAATAAAVDAGGQPGLDDLIARARALGDARHPGVTEAWRRVGAAGEALTPDVAAEVARANGGVLLGSDPGQAVAALRESADLFAALGDRGSELEARAAAGLALELSGAPGTSDEAALVLSALGKEASAAFDDGAISVRQYLNVRTTGLTAALHALEALDEDSRNPDNQDSLRDALETACGLAEELGSPHHVGRSHELLAQLSLLREDGDDAVRHLDACRNGYLAAAQPWYAARPEMLIADLSLRGGDPATAESYARDAIAHVHEPEPELAAQLSSLLTQAIGAQPDRLAEFAAASLTAAARWDGISQPDTLHHTFNAARAYAGLGHHAEAVALYDELITKVDVAYGPESVTRTLRDYALSLRETGRHREAAEQFLQAARLVEGDPAQAAFHAILAWEAAESLGDAGRHDESLAAYQRVIALFAEQGNTVARIRCQRARAWVEFATGQSDGTERAGLPAMRAVLAELESLAGSGAREDLAEELTATRDQLTAMVGMADQDGPDTDEDEH